MDVLNKAKLKIAILGGQSEWMVWAMKYGGVLLVFLFFFFPNQQRISNYASNEASLKTQIQDLEKISQGFLNDQEAQLMMERKSKFEAGLTTTDQAASLIRKITDHADKNHLKLVQIFSDSPILLKNANGEDLELHGQKLNLLPVSFRMEADYKNLGNFFHTLFEDSKEVYMVESLHIQKTSSAEETLQCDVMLGYVTK